MPSAACHDERDHREHIGTSLLRPFPWPLVGSRRGSQGVCNVRGRREAIAEIRPPIPVGPAQEKHPWFIARGTVQIMEVSQSMEARPRTAAWGAALALASVALFIGGSVLPSYRVGHTRPVEVSVIGVGERSSSNVAVNIVVLWIPLIVVVIATILAFVDRRHVGVASGAAVALGVTHTAIAATYLLDLYGYTTPLVGTYVCFLAGALLIVSGLMLWRAHMANRARRVPSG
jgi:hypothetical protein